MKIKVWEEEKKIVEEQPLRLRLVPYLSGGKGVTLIAVDKKGRQIDQGYLLHISENGQLKLHGAISKKLGLCLTDSGYLETK
jgi:hypothetical protein